MLKRIISNEVNQYVGQRVILQGWVHIVRKIGALSFIILRDRGGVVQIVAEKRGQLLPPLPLETIVEVVGTVVEEEQAPGGIEVRLEEIKILVPVSETPPVEINKKIEYSRIPLDAILNYRPITAQTLED